MLHITECKYLEHYRLELQFDNGTRGIVDLQNLSSGDTVFSPLRDVELFKKTQLDNGVITWLNGQIDIAPEYLFFLANQHDHQYTQLFQKWGYSISH